MSIADNIADIVEVPNLRIDAFDGSGVGPSGAAVRLSIRSPQALSYIVTALGELGVARAYVTGELDVEGDIYEAIELLSRAKLRPLSTWKKLALARRMGGLRLLRRPPIPPQEVRLTGRLHSQARDQEAITHHYDVSNRFYEWLLGSSMAYTCAVYRTETDTLKDAQWNKHDLVARKLGLRDGMCLLDVGCGWGGMAMHAARHYGVRVLAVTLSRRQAEWGRKKAADEGLDELVDIRHCDYRDVQEEKFDAISSIGLTEHIGENQLQSYFSFLYDKLATGGRLLNHCITRPDNRRRAAAGAFIGRYVFPDGELEGVGRIISEMHDAGFEVRHEENLREHYARTLAAWSSNLERHWQDALAEVGVARARIWRLYLAASRFGFVHNTIQLHQMLGVKTHPGGKSEMPLRPDWDAPLPR